VARDSRDDELARLHRIVTTPSRDG